MADKKYELHAEEAIGMFLKQLTADDEQEALRKEVQRLKEENARLEKENARLEKENAGLKIGQAEIVDTMQSKIKEIMDRVTNCDKAVLNSIEPVKQQERVKILLPDPVLWDRKKKINVKNYRVIDWANKMHEEVNEAHQCGALAVAYKNDGQKINGAVYSDLENAELFDGLTMYISRLNQKNIKPGSYSWNNYVIAVNKKNAERAALFEHDEVEDDGAD